MKVALIGIVLNIMENFFFFMTLAFAMAGRYGSALVFAFAAIYWKTADVAKSLELMMEEDEVVEPEKTKEEHF
jgi:hypothetical protein